MFARFIGGAVLLLCANVSAYGQSCVTQPLKAMTITSNYGMRYHPKFHIWRAHNGADLRAPMLTDVYAAQGGTVTYGGWMGGGGGNTVIVKNGSMETRYLHLSQVITTPGQTVSAGQKIALSGDTGEASTAPHLHFEVRDQGGAQPRDPRLYLCPRPSEVAGAGPEGAPDGSRPPTGSVASVPKSAPSGVPSKAQMIATQGEAFALDPEWKKQVYTITSAQTAFELLADLQAKRLETRARIASAEERLNAEMAIYLASELGSERATLEQHRQTLARSLGAR
jgi:hypothetical protein